MQPARSYVRTYVARVDGHALLAAMPLSQTESEVVQSVAAFSSILSGIGNAALLVHFAGWVSAPVHSQTRFAHRTLFFISATNLGQCIGFALGNLPVKLGAMVGCVAQALLLQFSGLSTVLWTLALAHGLWRSSCKGDGAKALLRYERPATYVAFGLPALSCIILWAQGDLGEEEDSVVQDQWCWIGVAGGSSTTDGELRFLSLYVWVALGWLWAIFVCFEVTKALQERTGAVSLLQRERAAEMARGATEQLRRLIGIFIAVWAGGLIARLYEVGAGEESFVLTLWQCATLPLAGFLNACSILLPAKLRERKRAIRTAGSGGGVGLSGSLLGATGSDNEFEDDAVALSPVVQTSEGNNWPTVSPLILSVAGSKAASAANGEEYSLAVLTWNLGEGKLSDPAQLGPLLLPNGADAAADIYLISLQECVDVDAWVSLVLASLQAGGAGTYTCTVEKIGSSQTWLGYHGHIAIVLLTSPSLSASNDFSVLGLGRQLKTGKTLPGGLGHLSNKGGVGLSFRLGGTSFAAVGCHLPSDSGGDKEGNMKSKLTKRNEQVHSLLNSLELDNLSGVEDVDCCDLFHHTFFLGDLNYRLDDSHNLDQTVAGIAKAMGVNAAAPVESEEEAEAWASLLRADELNIERAAGTVFDGWQEGRIAFPPSYRRRRELPSAGAFNSEDRLRAECYSINTGVAHDTVKTRKPAWCDRVLFHSLAGREQELQLLSYSTLEGSECAAVTVSDHVPVIARFAVHAAPHIMAATPTGGNVVVENSRRKRRLQLILSNMAIQCNATVVGHGATSEVDSEPNSAHGTIRLSSVVYPLPSEDELAPLRSTAELLNRFSWSGSARLPPALAAGRSDRAHDASIGSASSTTLDLTVPSAQVGSDRSSTELLIGDVWDRLCSSEGGVVLEFDVDEAGAWRQTHALMKLEHLSTSCNADVHTDGVVLGHFVVSLKMVADAVGSNSCGLLQLSLPVRRHSQRVATVSCGARLAEPPASLSDPLQAV
eukprot:COSAG02_NODE_5325_length_4437_cov_3.655832_1_plen_998_part_00